MNDGNAGAAAPVGTTSAPASGATGPSGTAGAGGAQQPAGGQQPPAGGQQPPAGGQQPTAAQTPPADAQQPPVGDFRVPDAYKDKPWASKVKNLDDVYKQLDNLDVAVGKKAIIPDLKTATPEQREAFYAQTRPKDIAEYEFPANPAFPTTPELNKAVAEMFMKNGVSAVQANEVTKAYQEFGAKQIAQQFDPEGMKTALTQAFGPEWEQVTRQTRNTIKGMMTAEDQAMLDKMPNNYLAPIYRTLGNVVKKFGVKATDTLGGDNPGSGNAGAAGGDSLITQRASIRTELANLGSQPHTVDQANALRQKLADTYKNDPRIQR